MLTESEILARQLDKAREMTRWYLSLLKEADPLQVFELDGKTFNSVLWEIAHLTVTENFLGLYLTYGPAERVEWATHFGLGSDNTPNADYPPFRDVLDKFKQVHEKTIQYIASLTPEDLDKPTKKEFNVAGIKTVRDAVIHSIRHESTHTGHLGWLCKLHGIKSI